MKKIHLNKFLLAGMVCCGIASLFTSCRFEEDDYFNESASLRVEHAIDQIQTNLSSAENGWVMQYFCGTGVAQFEGFNLFAKFDKNGKVTIAGNHRYLRDGNANKYTEASSLYSLLLEDGPVLAFNTWNDVLTPFVDPVAYYAAPGSLLKDGQGMEGDHNFVVMSNTENEIILRGERHSAEVRLVKCDRSWADYIADTETMKKSITNSSINDYYVINNANDTLYFSGLRNGRFRYTEDLQKGVKLDSLACVFTPNGFRTEHTDSIGSCKFHEFTLSEDKSCLKNEDGTVKVEARWDAYIANHTDVWNMDQEQFTEEQKSIYNKIEEALKNFKSDYSIKSIGIGKSSGNNAVKGLVISFYTNTAKTKSNVAGLELKMEKSAYGQMTITVTSNAKTDKNFDNIVSRSADFGVQVRAFAATLDGTYNIVPNDYFQPTGAQFNPINGGTAFKLN
jgi:hypothetical protein